MPSQNPQLSALLVVEPEKAYALIAQAIEKADGDVQKAASKLGVNRRTLYRWFAMHPKLGRKCSAIRTKGK